MNPDALLIFPPPYIPTELQPGIGAIKGYAEERGKNIEIIDANIESLEYILNKIDPKINESIEILKNIRSYTLENFEVFRDAKNCIEAVSKQVKHETFSFRRNTIEYTPRYEAQTRQGILDAISHSENNIFNEYYEKKLLPKIKEYSEKGCSNVGIGITDRKQAIPGFIIASKIKHTFPEMKVIAGGNFISRARDVFKKDDELNRELFNHLDYLIYLEGDKSFLELISGKNPAEIQKAIRKENGVVKWTDMTDITSAAEFPIPDFTGIKAWTPEPSASYNFQRGCNFGVCKFCAIMDGYDSYAGRNEKKPATFMQRGKGIEQVVNDLENLRKRGYKYINFTDETFLANDMEDISKLLIEKNIDIKWTAYARAEEKYADRKFSKLIAKAGCEFLQFGVESLSMKSLRSMRKGTDNTLIYSILQSTNDAGMMNHVFLLVGNPGETVEDALLLFPFLERTKNITYTIKPTWFKLARGSPYAYAPEGSIKRLYTEPELAPNLHFENTSGMSKKTAQAVNDLLQAWVNRNHVLNYVAGTYCYSQRFFSGPKVIREITEQIENGKILYEKEFGPNVSYIQREKDALNTVWKSLVGSEYHKMHSKYLLGNRNPKFLEAYGKTKTQDNPTIKLFPNGFKKIEDVVQVSYLIESSQQNL